MGIPVPPATSRCFIPGKGFNWDTSLKENKGSFSINRVGCSMKIIIIIKRNGKAKQQ
jgi:hypothetical protein